MASFSLLLKSGQALHVCWGQSGLILPRTTAIASRLEVQGEAASSLCSELKWSSFPPEVSG